ncbi:MAG: sigma 54-interacting transcriptional regulator [Myxococcota bacterium]
MAIPSEGTLVIGNASSAGVVLDDPYVSGRHACIRIARGGVMVQDLGSKNGTWVDGVVVERGWARLGAVLRFGRSHLRVICGHPTPPPHEDLCDGPVVGRSVVFRELLRTLERAARARSPVLLRGETGTGKEVAARVIHHASERRGGPFVALNCGAIPETLAESELFGHVKGAFTGAHRDRRGAFCRAAGGTLLLDEIAELPMLIQAKLLRVFETDRVLPVGAEREQPIDVRVVTATHRDLEGMIDQGELREDLYHRLGVLSIRLPPLRERPDDIPVLLEHFASQASRELGYPVELTEAARTAATHHLWPGNVRALRNAVFRAGALADGPIEPADLVPSAISQADLAPPGCVLVPRGSYDTMRRVMVKRIVEEEGSVRRAARVLEVPRSTLGNWLRR